MAGDTVAPPNGPFTQLVVIGASAGGVEALRQVVPDIGPDFPAPVVIAQHLDPRRPSQLLEILSARTGARVHVVEDGAKLEAGTVFIVPANRNVSITDSTVSVHEGEVPGDTQPHPAGPRPSIDMLFRTASEAYGEGLIAVVLTGTGSDGAAGARYVKAAGGTVIIQNPATASFPGMPQSLDPTTVDAVADLDRIGPLLRELLAEPGVQARPDQDRQLRDFLTDLREHSGIDFSNYKPPTIYRRLQRRIAATRTDDLAGYIRHLRENPEEYQRLVSSFLIKVTEFFRDPELFSYLREHVVPGIIAEGRRRGNEIRLWSAGCATGEEAYSLAILVTEALGDQADRFNVRIFATDLDEDAVTYARRGIYPSSALESMPAELVTRYFSDVDGSFEVKKRIRALVIFGQHDLGQRAPFPRIDLALCRNVLIYFTPELQKRALHLFAFSLRDRGYLVLGKAETVSPLAELFTTEHPHLKIYRRHGDRVLIPPARIRDSAPLPMPRPLPARRNGGDGPLPRPPRDLPRARPPGERPDHLLLRLPVGVALVDHRYDIQFINAHARRLLGIHSAGIGDDLVHLTRAVGPAGLRSAIDSARSDEPHSVILEVAGGEAGPERPQFLEFTCQRYAADGAADGNGYVIVLVRDLTQHQLALHAAAQAAHGERAEKERIAAELQRLTAVNSELIEANQELATANAEMRSANEEYLVSSEEAQAATEEVETLNEELQATNEELETLNEELQATVEELNTTNDDLQSRSVELQEMTVTLEQQRRQAETERRRLDSLIASIDLAVMVVDSAGQLTYTNPAFDQTFGTGRPFIPLDADGRVLAHNAGPLGLASNGQPFTSEFTHDDASGERRRFVATGRPVPADAGGPALVITIRPT